MSTPAHPIDPPAGTQASRLLEVLRNNPAGLCGGTILENYEKWRISHRYAATVKILKDNYGHNIENASPCPLAFHHHRGNMAFYVLHPPAPMDTLFELEPIEDEPEPFWSI